MWSVLLWHSDRDTIYCYYHVKRCKRQANILNLQFVISQKQPINKIESREKATCQRYMNIYYIIFLIKRRIKQTRRFWSEYKMLSDCCVKLLKIFTERSEVREAFLIFWSCSICVFWHWDHNFPIKLLRPAIEKYRSSMPLFFSFAWFRNDVKRIPGAVPTESRRAKARRLAWAIRRDESLANIQRDLFAARDATGKRMLIQPCSPAARAGGIQVVGVSRVHIYIYLIRDISQMLTILRLEFLFDLLATPHHRLVQLLLHDVTVISGRNTTCRRPPVDLPRLIPGRASLNIGSRTS